MIRSAVSKWRTTRRLDPAIGLCCALIGSRFTDLQGDASTLYQVSGGAAVGLIAFVVTPVATLLTLSGGIRSMAFDRRHRPVIIRSMAWGFAMSLSLLAVSVTGGAIDDPQHPSTLLRWLTIACAIAAGLAAARLFWFFTAALSVREADLDRPLHSDSRQ